MREGIHFLLDNEDRAVLNKLKEDSKGELIINYDSSVWAGSLMGIQQLAWEPGLDLELKRDRQALLLHQWRPSVTWTPSHTNDKLSDAEFVALTSWPKGNHRVDKIAEALLEARIQVHMSGFGFIGEIRSTRTGEIIRAMALGTWTGYPQIYSANNQQRVLNLYNKDDDFEWEPYYDKPNTWEHAQVLEISNELARHSQLPRRTTVAKLAKVQKSLYHSLRGSFIRDPNITQEASDKFHALHPSHSWQAMRRAGRLLSRQKTAPRQFFCWGANVVFPR